MNPRESRAAARAGMGKPTAPLFVYFQKIYGDRCHALFRAQCESDKAREAPGRHISTLNAEKRVTGRLFSAQGHSCSMDQPAPVAFIFQAQRRPIAEPSSAIFRSYWKTGRIRENYRE